VTAPSGPEWDAAEWRALQAVIGHPERDAKWPVECYEKGCAVFATHPPVGQKILTAPDFPALLAKLDALAEARKPKAGVWRMRSPGGGVSQTAGTSADDIRFTLGSWEDGTPVREVVNAAGDILLLAEGRPIPTEGGPWT